MLKNLINLIIGGGKLICTLTSEERSYERVAYMLYENPAGRRYYRAKSTNMFFLSPQKTLTYATVIWPWLNGNNKPLERLRGKDQ